MVRSQRLRARASIQPARLTSKPSTDSREIAEGLVADFDAEGNIVGIDIQHASEKLDLKTLETEALPAATVRIA